MGSPSERPSFPPAVLEALRKGNKLEAMKLLRQASKAGPVEVKSKPEHRGTVGAHAVTPARPIPGYIPHSHSGLSPGEVPRGGGQAGWIFVVVAALVAIFVLA